MRCYEREHFLSKFRSTTTRLVAIVGAREDKTKYIVFVSMLVLARPFFVAFIITFT